MSRQEPSPVVIEAAISAVVANTSGTTLTTQNIIDDAKACLGAGAGIIHYHHDFAQTDAQSMAQCVSIQRGILDAHPGTLMYPGYLKGETAQARMLHHLKPLRDAGVLTMFAFDPGLATHARPGVDGLPSASITGGTTFAEAADMVAYSHSAGVPCSLGIFEPGALRWVRSYGAARKFTPGTIVKFYFAGGAAWGEKGTGPTFGLPPSKEALDIYLSLIEGSGLPWIATILGGSILEDGLARYVLERGGNLRVGVEDPLRPMDVSNVDLVRAAVDLANQVGRPVARSSEAFEVLAGPSEPLRTAA